MPVTAPPLSVSQPRALRADASARVRVPTTRATPRVTSRRPGLLAFALLSAFFLTACTMHTESFDADTWKSQRGVAASNNRRGPLVASIDNVVRSGKSRADVVGLLGAPDSTRTGSSIDVYELGRSPYGVDEEFYEVRYVDGKVQSHGMGRR